MTLEAANDVVMREVFARIDAQSGLPAVVETVERWRPHLVIRESAELASLAAAERAGVPHVHVCIGMHEVVARFAEAVHDRLEELEGLAGLDTGQLRTALASEPVISLVPEALDRAAGDPGPEVDRFHRFRNAPGRSHPAPLPDWGDPDAPLVYVTFGSVTGSLPPFAGVFRAALDALAAADVRVLMTVGRKVEVSSLGPLPSNAHVVQWWPQDGVLPHASAVLGHGGFGTTLGAVAAGVPQVVAPIFSFDQVVNGAHVAAVGAGLTVRTGPDVVERAAGHVHQLLTDASYAAAAREMATTIRRMPPAADAVPVLEELAT
jgi:hypothetical protein